MITTFRLFFICFTVAITAVIAGCGGKTSAQKPEVNSDSIKVVLSWNSDADMDLEIWRASDTGPVMLDESFDLNGGGEDEVSGLNSQTESFVFSSPFDSGTFYPAVSFWAPGPSQQNQVEVNLVVSFPNGRTVTYQGQLHDDTKDLWLPAEIKPQLGEITKVDQYKFRGL